MVRALLIKQIVGKTMSIFKLLCCTFPSLRVSDAPYKPRTRAARAARRWVIRCEYVDAEGIAHIITHIPCILQKPLPPRQPQAQCDFQEVEVIEFYQRQVQILERLLAERDRAAGA